MVAVALPAISRDFGAEASSVTLLVVTVYLIATLVCQMPSGSIADRAGYGRALTWGRWIFAAGAAAGAFAPTLAVVVLGRILMAAGGSLMIPTAMALVRVEVPAERRPRAFGALGAALGAAAAIGPALGGWVAPLFGWRWLFAINLPGARSVVAVAAEEGRTEPPPQRTRWPLAATIRLGRKRC